MARSSLEPHRSSTGLDNTTYNIISALAQEADFLYSTAAAYIDDARKENRPQAEQIWQTIKDDKTKHIGMLKAALSKEATENKIGDKMSIDLKATRDPHVRADDTDWMKTSLVTQFANIG